MKKGTKILIYILVVFLFQEIVVRICFPVPELKNFDRVSYMVLSDKVSNVPYSRNQNYTWVSMPDTNHYFLHEMNQYGFRDDEWTISKTEGKKRVLFIGDSFVEGVMAEQNQSIPEVFESFNDQLDVMNGGMLGVGLDSYLTFGADVIPLFQPDVAILCIYSNDLGKSAPKVPQYYLEPEYYSFFKPRFIEVIQQNNDHGPIRARWKLEPKPYLPALPDSANPWFFFEEEFSKQVTPEIAQWMKKAEFNPHLPNRLMKEEFHLKHTPNIGETIPFFQYTCAQNKVLPVIVYIPTRNQVTNHYKKYEQEYCLSCPDTIDLTQPAYQIHQKTLEEHCNMFNVQFIDLTPVIRQQEESGNHLFWNYDQHMRAKGYQIVAETIWKQLQQ